MWTTIVTGASALLPFGIGYALWRNPPRRFRPAPVPATVAFTPLYIDRTGGMLLSGTF
jgi:hypothetical protein